jgi:hypothetical protein
MKRILGVAAGILLLLGSATAGFCDLAPVQIFYQLTPQPTLGSDVWEYSYTVKNISLQDSLRGVSWFTTFFPVDQNGLTSPYSDINVVGTRPNNWLATAFQPFQKDSYGNLIYGGPSGMYDARWWSGASTILPNTSLSGFNVTFTYKGLGSPGSQYFQVVDLSLEDDNHIWQKIWFTGYTTPLVAPVPSSALMLASGLFGLGLVRRKR